MFADDMEINSAEKSECSTELESRLTVIYVDSNNIFILTDLVLTYRNANLC